MASLLVHRRHRGQARSTALGAASSRQCGSPCRRLRSADTALSLPAVCLDTTGSQSNGQYKRGCTSPAARTAWMGVEAGCLSRNVCFVVVLQRMLVLRLGFRIRCFPASCQPDTSSNQRVISILGFPPTPDRSAVPTAPPWHYSRLRNVGPIKGAKRAQQPHGGHAPCPTVADMHK